MPRIQLIALLPDHDGQGWHAIIQGRNRPHVCSTKGCDEPAVAFHRWRHTGGQDPVWRNKYRCPACLPDNLEVLGNRVWTTIYEAPRETREAVEA